MISTIILAVLILISALNDINTVQDMECEDKIKYSFHETISKIDKRMVISIAENSNYIKSSSKSFNGIFYTYNVDENCLISLEEINISYIINDNSKQPLNMLTVILNPELKIKDVKEEPILYNTNSYWGGYELKANTQVTKPITETKVTFTIPTVSKPNSNQYGNDYACRVDITRQCLLSMWTGLSDADGYNLVEIMQGTILGNVTCTSNNCITTYRGTLQFFRANDNSSVAIYCTNSFNSGNSVRIWVYKAGNNATHTFYTIDIYNQTTRRACAIVYATQKSYTYADFVGEIPAYINIDNRAILPKFTTTNIQGWIYYDNLYSSIYVSYMNGWYIKDYIQVNGFRNVDISNIKSDGTFTIKYITSKGT
ncbi:MAG: G1 family glutamic endopeptidase [Candidatus Nitrosocaldaceae archaeon]